MDATNVKVAVRVRPLLQKEILVGEQSCIRALTSSSQIVIGKDRSFTYDYVFGAKAAQNEVYEQCFRPLITACHEGYNCTVFAYGQTGSGKTYTIGGNIGILTEDEFGILPRAIGDLFQHMQKNDKIEYKLRVSYFEIYKDDLCDLLDTDSQLVNKEIHIREDESGNTVITGAAEVECVSLDDVMACLQSGSAIRHTGSTQMNEHSSRSHSIFTILLEQRWYEAVDEDETRDAEEKYDTESILDKAREHFKYSKFHFVDLAGSERAHKTGNIGDRFKESIHINTGLLAIGNVISALGDPRKKVTHIPYRDAKITRILKDSLGGNAKTLMICCVSPCVSSIDESLNSLKYANRARNIENKPVINRDKQSLILEEMQTEIMNLREELARQRTFMYDLGDVDSQLSRPAASAERRQLEHQLTRIRTECSHYRMLAEEAYNQLVDIQTKQLLSKSQVVRLRDWLELVDEVKNRVPVTLDKDRWTNEQHLEIQLEKAKEDLKNDEMIFLEKNKEISQLEEKISQLEESNSEMANENDALLKRTMKQEDQLFQVQMLIEETRRKQSTTSTGSSDDDAPVVDGQTPLSARRVKSVPANPLHRRANAQNDFRPPPREIHTSPGLISLERVMQGFRARSHLLANQLEDDDDVRQHLFNSDSLTDEEGSTEGRGLVRRGTYKLTRSNQRPPLPDVGVASADKSRDAMKSTYVKPDQVVSDIVDEMNLKQLHEGADIQRRKIKDSQLKLQNANQKMRDLAINIRLKEQLIRDLVKSGKEADTVNRQYAEKIKHLERERTQAKVDVAELQKALNELAEKGQQESAQKNKLQMEVQKKLEAAKHRMQGLQRKQHEVEKVANITGHNKNKIRDLEGAIEKMRRQQEQLQRKLKEESDRKEKLEKEMIKEQQKISDLEIRNEQQQKILKRKTEEIAAVQRRLRNGSASHSDEQEKIDEQKKWLDGEIDRVVQLRHNMESLQEDLKKREEIVNKKEAIMAEKSRLEMKKLRSSQCLNKDMLSVVNKLADVEREITRKSHDFTNTSDDRRDAYRQDLESLRKNRLELVDKRNFYNDKLHMGKVLSDDEERRLIELDEAVEALDVAIDYKTETIRDHETNIRRSQIILQGEGDLNVKLGAMSTNDCRTLLTKYFERVVELREAERRRALRCSELEVRTDEQERLIKALEVSLDHGASELDRRLTHQQQLYEKKIQTLVHQLSHQSQGGAGDTSERISDLERDLYYYKKTSRDLKRKLRELTGEQQPTTPNLEHRGEGMEIVGRSIDSMNRATSARDDANSRPSSGRLPNQNGGVVSGAPRSIGVASDQQQQQQQQQQHDAAPASLRWKAGPPGAADVRTATPVRVSKKDVRHISQEELALRKSNLSRTSIDSLEPGAKTPCN